MALIETRSIDLIQLMPNNDVHVREVIVVVRDGVQEVSRTYHRRSLPSGSSLVGEDPRVAAVATAAWTGAPPPEPFPAVPPRIVTKVTFARLFTAAERITIREVAKTSGPLADFNELLSLCDTVNLDHADVLSGLTALTNAGLLATGRQARILSNQPPL